MNDLNLYRELEALKAEVREQMNEVRRQIAQLLDAVKNILPNSHLGH